MKKKNVYPSKGDVNLLHRDGEAGAYKKYVVGVLFFCILLFFFTKYAVVGRLYGVWEMEQQAKTLEQQVNTLKKGNAEYEALLRDYQHYYSDGAEEIRAMYANVDEVLAILDKDILSVSAVSNITFDGTNMTVALSGTTLQKASSVIHLLEAEPLVRSVSLSTANTQDLSADAAVYLTMQLAVGGGEQDAK